MSYCRINADSDCYVYATGGPVFPGDVIGEGDDLSWVCCGCLLADASAAGDADEPAHIEHSAAGMLRHLREHRAAGHRVPDHAIDRLTTESKGPTTHG